MNKAEFLLGVDNWSNHRHLLYPALEATKDSPHPVLEMGCGDGSTPFLKKYCESAGRKLRSMDNNKTCAERFGAEHTNWNPMEWFYKRQYSVVLIDHAPGEKRREALELFAQFPIHFQVLVVHDSEPKGWNASDYQVRPVFNRFKYMIDYKSEKPGAWASALSNNIDVTKFL
jgi:hypothetical protein